MPRKGHRGGIPGKESLRSYAFTRLGEWSVKTTCMRIIAVLCVLGMAATAFGVLGVSQNALAKGGGKNQGAIPWWWEDSSWSDLSFWGPLEMEPYFLNDDESPDYFMSTWGPESLAQGFIGGIPSNDWGAVTATPYIGTIGILQPSSVSLWFKVANYYHNDDPLDMMKSGIRFNLYDESFNLIESFEYWLASWSGSEDEMPVSDSFHEVSVYGKPQMNEWIHFMAHPMTDFPQGDWTSASYGDIQFFTEGEDTQMDMFAVHYDSLIVTQQMSIASYVYKEDVLPSTQNEVSFEVPEDAEVILATMSYTGSAETDLRLTTPSSLSTGGHTVNDPNMVYDISLGYYSGRDKNPEGVLVCRAYNHPGMWSASVYNDYGDLAEYTLRIDVYIEETLEEGDGTTFDFEIPAYGFEAALSQDIFYGRAADIDISLWDSDGLRSGGNWIGGAPVTEIPFSEYHPATIFEPVEVVEVHDYVPSGPGLFWTMGAYCKKGTAYYHLEIKISEATLDTDGDDLSDYDETYIYGTNPETPFTDADSWNDYDEIFVYYTNPCSEHTDSDSYPDDMDTDPLTDLHLYVDLRKAVQLDSFNGGDLFDGFFKVEVTAQWSQYGYITLETQISANPETSPFIPVLDFNIPDYDIASSITVSFKLIEVQSNTVCDIDKSGTDDGVAEVVFDCLTNEWTSGDEDSSGGTGHFNGEWDLEDDDDDCELWFNMYLNDVDSDGITYSEELLNGLNPTICNGDLDTDGDGATNAQEWTIHSRWDRWDSDADGLADGFELSASGLNPLMTSDAGEFRQDLISALQFPQEANMAYGTQFSYSHLYNLRFAEDIGFDELTDDYIYERTDEVELLLTIAGELEPWGGPWNPITTAAELAIGWLEFALSEWIAFNIIWMCYDWDQYDPFPTSPLGAGMVYQINYGQSFSDEISSTLYSLASACSELVSSVEYNDLVKSQWSFNEMNADAQTAFNLFGNITEVDSYETAPVRDEDGNIHYKVLKDPGDSVWGECSDIEELVYQFILRLEQNCLPVTYEFDVGYESDISVGDVAQDLINVIYNLFGLVKSQRLLFEGLACW